MTEDEKVCSQCGEEKDSVSMRINPYESELYGNENDELICDECYLILLEDI